MNILNLAEELNLFPKRASSTKGGEYKSICPQCQGGTDRFCIWPNQGGSGRYWCRVCDCKGDGIQFCRDFLGMTFQQACQRLSVTPSFRERIIGYSPFKSIKFTPHPISTLHQSWQKSAKNFIETSHGRLLENPKIIETLTQRGLLIQTIQDFVLGWNPEDLFDERERWGMEPLLKDNGYPKKQWLPKGIVIPAYSNQESVKIKIRRTDWHSEDVFPKYVEVAGSSQSPVIYGDKSKAVMVVESELDAILIQQSAAHLVCCLALGGVSKKPDEEIHRWLQQAPVILLSLDFDEAGKKKCAFWMKLYPNLKPWPAPQGKSVGDAFEMAPIDLLNWIKISLF